MSCADPAAPVAKSAQDTQEVKKSPTPPPQETPAIQGLLEGQPPGLCVQDWLHALEYECAKPPPLSVVSQ